MPVKKKNKLQYDTEDDPSTQNTFTGIDMTSTPSSCFLFDTVPQDCMNKIFTFLSFRDLCSLRRCCKTFDATVLDESFWAQMCADQGIEGTIIDDSTPEDVASEPHPLKFFGPPPQLDANALVPWQLLAKYMSTVSSGCCSHVGNKNHVEQFIELFGARLKQMRHKLPETCENCHKSTATIVCTRCGLCLGSRSGQCGCIASHECQGDQSLPHLGLRIPYAEVYCYPCNRPISNATPLGTDTALMMRSAAVRDLNTAVHHFGLFQRNQCPHLDEELLSKVRKWSKYELSRMCNDKCCKSYLKPGEKEPAAMMMTRASRMSAPPTKCTSMRVWVCLTCKKLFCNNDGKGEQHLTRHAKETHHFVAIALRTLNIWCFSCDRYVGFGGSVADHKMGMAVRRCFRTPNLCQHKEFPDPPESEI